MMRAVTGCSGVVGPALRAEVTRRVRMGPRAQLLAYRWLSEVPRLYLYGDVDRLHDVAVCCRLAPRVGSAGADGVLDLVEVLAVEALRRIEERQREERARR